MKILQRAFHELTKIIKDYNFEISIQKTNRNETQIKFYKAMAISAGLYGSKNWVLTEKDKNRIQAAKMRFLDQCSE
jgi:uncharacterized GH25 family protein